MSQLNGEGDDVVELTSGADVVVVVVTDVDAGTITISCLPTSCGFDGFPLDRNSTSGLRMSEATEVLVLWVGSDYLLMTF